jgi:proteasome lid subunit RPN8/RPN11
MLIAERAEPGSAATPAEPNTVAATFVCQPREHGVIEHTPATLAELHSLLADGGDNLLGGLRDHLRGWKETAPLGAKVAIVVIIPLRRTATGPIERHEAWAFLSAVTLKEIGVAVGIWVVQDQHVGLLMPRDETQRGESVPLALVDVVSKLSRATAAALNGYLPAADLNVVAIGCGALGSQIILNAARGSFGRWTLVDKDHLLPHNLARHALTNGVGLPKAVGLSFWVDGIVDDAPAPQAIVADVLNPGDTAATLDAVLSEAHLVLDMSTSIPVARHLTLDVTCPGRRASVFLNPQGTDLVLLIEDADRRVALDSLEMQYYRSILERPELLGHLANPQGRLRYGRTCRDVTFTLPQELVGLHAGIACGALRRAMDSPTARIVIWQADQLQGSVVPVSVEPNHARRVVVDDWTVVTDDGFLSKLMDCRRARLPNETGGVLLGALDLQRKIVYVVDALPSPADSEEYPTHYIRGSQGLRTQVEESARKTGDQLQYVGEWHSHPDGYGATPSGDDAQVLAWVRDDLERDGLPAVMLIASEGGRVAVFVSAMTPGHWPPHVLHAAGS